MTITNACYLFGIVDIFRENVLFLDLLLSPIFSSQKSVSFLRYKEHTSLKWLIKKKVITTSSNWGISSWPDMLDG